MNKNGRPKSENSRTQGYRVRLNDEEMDRLNSLSKKNRKSKAEIIRLALLIYEGLGEN